MDFSRENIPEKIGENMNKWTLIREGRKKEGEKMVKCIGN